MPKPQEKQPNLNDVMQGAFTKVRGEYPDVKPVTLTPSDSLLTKWMLPRNAQAVTNPFTGNIMYDPNMMQGLNQDEIENTLAHELTHSRQAQQDSWVKTAMQMFMPQEEYNMRPNEMQAFQTERDRALSHHLTTPSPQSGAMDIPLPNPNKRQKMFGSK